MLSQLTRLPRALKVLILAATDSLLGALALCAAVYLRVGGLPLGSARYVMVGAVLAAFFAPAAGFAFGLYRSVTRFAAPALSLRVALVSFTCGSIFVAIALFGGAVPGRSITFGMVFALVLFVFQVLSRQFARWFVGDSRMGGRRVAVYGAGAAGRQLVSLMRAAPDFTPVLFIDDDKALHGRTVEDLLVIASEAQRLQARLAAQRIEEIFLAIPSLKAGRRRQILEALAQFPYRVRVVPGLAELVKGHAALGNARDVSIEDLLGRETVAPLPGLLDRCIRDKTVLVTGGGGSIGAELCRQVLALSPARLIVLEHGEFSLYQIEQELREASRKLAHGSDLEFILGSVTDPATLARVFGAMRIDTVYHAAAYKHVPIVESNALEGFKNNVLGTWHLAQAAAKAEIGHFVLISSDKAVRPTNVMGATKRMAEIALQVMAERHPRTIFSMVRFGNVLESSGSVVPLFRRQIEAGGPVTVTHPEVTRYFMTIQEAVQLVIQAGAMARGGEVFVLDMGQPVRIYDLAQRMIRLSGRSIRDEQNSAGEIAIETIGLRPGEKMYEELLISGQAVGTAHPRIWQVREPAADAAAFGHEIGRLAEGVKEASTQIDVREILARWVVGFAMQAEARLPSSVAYTRDRAAPAGAANVPARRLGS